jgi:hypothetical protein
MTPTTTCKSCGNQFSGKFCNHCGEKVYSDHDKSLKHFFEEAFHFITHFDSKFLKTVKLVFLKPGFVSKEICSGVRKKYFKPVSLFLIGVVIYLLFPVMQGMNISFANHLGQYNSLHFELPAKWAGQKAVRKNISLEEVGRQFDTKSIKVSKLLLFLIIPLTGAWLKLLFRRRSEYYFDHFTLAAEMNTFFLYLIFLLVPMIMTIVYWISSMWGSGWDVSYGDTLVSGSLFTLLLIIYIIVALKRFYDLNAVRTILKSLLFLAGHYVIVYVLYRLILFSIVMLLI